MVASVLAVPLMMGDSGPRTTFVAYGAAVTWNASDKGSNIVLSGGNLIATSGAGSWECVRATASKNSGAWYWEHTITGSFSGGGTNHQAGGGDSGFTLTSPLGGSAVSWGISPNATNVNGVTAASTAPATAWAASDVIMCALNMTSKTFWVGRNGTWFNGGNPALGISPIVTALPATVFAAIGLINNVEFTTNFGATAFAFTPPA